MNTNSITLHTAKRFIVAHIRQMLDTGVYGEPIMLHSSPGVGKSAIIAQTGNELKSEFEAVFDSKFKIWDVRVGAQQESDIQGIPYPTDVEVVNGCHVKDMMFSTPSWFPKKGECGILLLDELANAPIANQHACYRLIHDRSIHNGSTLPDGVIVLAAGNTKDDKTGAKGIVPALARRFMAHFLVKPSVDEFTQYAMERKIHPTIMAYLNATPGDLVKKPMAGEYGFACPANWESASKILKNPHMDSDLREMGLVGCLNSATGMEFIGFLRNERFYPNFDEVEKTGQYELPTDDDFDRGAVWAIVMATTVRIIDNLEAAANGETGKEVDKSIEKANNLAAILESLDVSTAGVAFRTMKVSNKKVMSVILREENLSRLSTLVVSVMKRASSMTKGQ